MWWWIAAFVVSMVASYFLMPRPEVAKPPEVEEVDIPTVEDGKTIPVLFGIRDTESFNVVWWGDVNTREFKVSGGDSTWYMDIEDVHGGYRYFVGIHAILFHGPIDYITKVESDDKVAWTGEQSDGIICDIGSIELYGDVDAEGGFGERSINWDDGDGDWPSDGCLEILMGYPDQARNWYLEHNLGGGDAVGDTGAHEIPAFRGVVSAVFNRFYIGNSPNLRKIKFRGQRIHLRQDGVEQWYDAKAAVSGPTCNYATEISLYIAMDFSGSMDVLTGNGNSRHENQIIAVTAALIEMQSLVDNNTIANTDILLVGWGTYGYISGGFGETVVSSYRRNVTSDTIQELIDWLDSTLPIAGQTDTWYPGAFKTYSYSECIGVDAFFDATTTTKARVSIFTSDGVPEIRPEAGISPLENAVEAGDAIMAVDNIHAHSVGIDQRSSAYLDYLDNTGGHQTITGEDTTSLTAIILDAIKTESIPDMNPSHLIRECLTDPDWGMGGGELLPDEDAFVYAADYLYNEEMGISIKWTAQTSIDDFIDLIKRHINAELYPDHSTGKQVLKLIRDDYDVNDLITLGEDDIVKVENAKRPLIGELINSVTVQYWDSCTGKDASVTVVDQALVQMQGSTINTTIQYPGFTHKTIATRAAIRDLRVLSTQLFSCTLHVKRTAETLNLGDVFIQQWPDLEIDGLIMRVQGIDFGTGRSNTIKLDVVEDVFSLPTVVVVDDDDDDPTWINPSQLPTPAEYQLDIEAPYYELLQNIGERNTTDFLADEPELGYAGIAAARSGNAINAQVYTDAGAGYISTGTLDFCATCTLTAGATILETAWTIENGIDLSLVVVGEYAQVDDELIRIDAIDTTAGTLTVGRAVLDTSPRIHALGARIFFLDTNYHINKTEYVKDDVVDLKVLPTTGKGTLEITHATSRQVTFAQRAYRPYPPADMQIGGVSYPSGGQQWSIDVTWAHRDRLIQANGTLLDHEDAGVGPEAGTTYTLYVIDSLDATQITHAGETGTSKTVDMSGEAYGDYTLQIWAVRDAVTSWQCAEWGFTFISPTSGSGAGTLAAFTGSATDESAESFYAATYD